MALARQKLPLTGSSSESEDDRLRRGLGIQQGVDAKPQRAVGAIDIFRCIVDTSPS
jgi:hypothetical protein